MGLEQRPGNDWPEAGNDYNVQPVARMCETAIIINGVVTVLSALVILFPRTFVLGNSPYGGNDPDDHLLFLI